MSEPRFTAVVLAAGMSRRMGRLKMLLPFGDRPMLARVIESLQASGQVSRIFVVTGHAEQEIRAVVEEYAGVACVQNTAHAEGGMLSSVKTGVAALPRECEAFFLALGDQPMVRPATLRKLAGAWHPMSAPIVAPEFKGKRGHPVLITHRLSEELQALGESDTLKTLMLRHAHQSAAVPVDDPATVQDVDTPSDYEAALCRWRETEH